MRSVIETINRQANRTQITIGIICFLLGFMLVTQIKGQLAVEKPLQNETEKNLAAIANELNGEAKALKAELATLDLQLYKVRLVADDKDGALAETKNAKQRYEMSASVIPVEGRGVRLVVNDKQNRLSGVDMNDIVNELRAAGAEAIAVNGKRVVFSTSFGREGGGMVMSGSKIDSPYRFESVGDPDTLSQALTMAGGIKDTLTASVTGVSFEVKSLSKIRLSGASAPTYKYAKPVVK